MEALVIVGFLILMTWLVRKDKEAHRRLQEAHESAQASRIRREAEEYVENIKTASEELANLHIHTLWTKWKQLCYKDDYGNVIDANWRRELGYFIDNVVAPRTYFDPDTAEDDKEYATNVIIDAVLAYDMDRDMEYLSTHDIEAAYDAGMSGVEFENLVESLLARAGADVRRTSVTGDQGVDLIAELNGSTFAIQCKRSASTIGNKAVQEVSAGRLFYGTDHALVVSDSSFTKSARQLASSLGVELVHYLGLRQHICRASAEAAE